MADSHKILLMGLLQSDVITTGSTNRIGPSELDGVEFIIMERVHSRLKILLMGGQEILLLLSF